VAVSEQRSVADKATVIVHGVPLIALAVLAVFDEAPVGVLVVMDVPLVSAEGWLCQPELAPL